MINNKAQMAGQILVYVLAIIVFSLTLFYGYKAISYFSDRSAEISYLQVENNMKNSVEKVRGDTKGSIKKKELTIPGNFKHICFTSSYGDSSYTFKGNNIAYNLIEDHLDSGGTDKNMFLAPPGDISFYIGEIVYVNSTTNNGCIDIRGGRVVLKLESMGNHVRVSEW